jgi:hypothetical protein
MEKKDWKHFALGLYLIVMSVLLTYFVLSLWHIVDLSKEKIWESNAPLFIENFIITPEMRLILLVVFAGALGSYIHSATSFATYKGNKSLVDSWFWWYILRPFIGMTLALIFYFTVRGGFLLLSTNSDVMNMSPFGIGAISGLVGMFSKQATDKLSEVFTNLFQTAKGKGDDERSNKLGEMKPVRDLMLPAGNITACELKNGNTKDNVTVKELFKLLKGVVTRIPVWNEKGAAEYIIHQSLLFKYISTKSIEASGKEFDIAELSLNDFLKFEDMAKMVGESLAFVSIDSTIGDAKSAMDKVTNCRDVIVTDTGDKKEKVRGWLTDIEISKHLSA